MIKINLKVLCAKKVGKTLWLHKNNLYLEKLFLENNYRISKMSQDQIYFKNF